MSQASTHNPIPLFYWSERKLLYKEKENYGDLISIYLVEKISGREVTWVHPKKQPWYKWNKTNFVTIGSIIHHSTKDSIVWGSGIIDKQQPIAKADFRAVRGPQTRKFLLGLDYECPKVYGDPALLLPKFYNPEIEKKYKLGVIPHYHDFLIAKELFNNDPDILVVDLMTLDVEEVTRQIMSCKKTISSSLHGIIVSQAYNIPSVWVKFSNKLFGDGVKYLDYFESIAIKPYDPIFLTSERKVDPYTLFGLFSSLPSIEKIKDVQNGLMEVCPFLPGT